MRVDVLSFMFLLFCIALGLLLGLIVPVTSIHWRIVDVSAILLGGVGFFSIVGEASRLIPANTLQYKRMNAAATLSGLKHCAGIFVSLICVKFIRTEISPPTLDLDQRQHDIACPWARNIVKSIEDLDSSLLPTITREIIPPLPAGAADNSYLNDRREDILKWVDWYIDARSSLDKHERSLERSGLEELAIFLGPFLVAAAVGLALFKATYGPQ